jgi:carbonic anhydrase
VDESLGGWAESLLSHSAVRCLLHRSRDAFDGSRGEFLDCRVADNFASDETIASIEYAVAVFNTAFILVLGYHACGAAIRPSSPSGMTSLCHIRSSSRRSLPHQCCLVKVREIVNNAIRRNAVIDNARSNM